VKAVLDENLPSALASALHSLCRKDGHTVSHVSELLQRGSPDVDVFRALHDGGYTVHISKDHHHRKPLERKVISECGLIVFVLARGWAGHKYWEMSAQLVRWWPLILDHAERTSPPAAFRVPWKTGNQRRFEVIQL
jgi:hypothetical protein